MMIKPPLSPAPKLMGVQYLRAVAALMVVYFHLGIQLPEYTQLLTTRAFIDTGRLKSGVDIFFVISGFIMFVTSRKITPGEFAVRRIFRIVPLYWLLTIALALLLALRPQQFRTTTLSGEYLVKSLLFIPYPNPSEGSTLAPLLVPGWTLNFEMIFYAVFAAVLFAPSRFRIVICGLVFCVFCLLGHLADGAATPVLSFYGSPQIFEFWMGMLIGHFFLQNKLRLPRAACIALIAGGFVSLLFNYEQLPLQHRYIGDSICTFLIPSTAIVLGTVSLDQRGRIGYHRLPMLLGDASYSLYLTHVFFLGLARAVWSKMHVQQVDWMHAAAFAGLSLLLTLCGAVLVYRTIEKPLHNLLQSAYRRGRSPAVVPG